MIGIDGSVLVEGFDHRPAMTIPYNYPYLRRLHQGFRLWEGHGLSFRLREWRSRVARLYDIAAKEKAKRGFSIKTFASKDEIRQWIPQAMAVHREAMSGLHSFFPPSEAETRAVINSLLMIIDPSSCY